MEEKLRAQEEKEVAKIKALEEKNRKQMEKEKDRKSKEDAKEAERVKKEMLKQKVNNPFLILTTLTLWTLAIVWKLGGKVSKEAIRFLQAIGEKGPYFSCKSCSF